ncbi:ATP-binding protein [Sphingomonas sp. SAFR-052]|uniref:ATP-binding protein n=1 Tax=Sphingomonas sp. SAFR-052 TaxID=3436867 RepID=UPI003F81598F
MSSLPLSPLSLLRAARPSRGDLPWIAGYAIAFLVSHHVAAAWGGQGYYSLLYPAAGLRLALLWSRGPRLTLSITTAELVVQTANGVIVPGAPEWIAALLGVARPPLIYGLSVWAVRRLAPRLHSTLGVAPMPLALVSVVAPLAAALVSLPWALLRPELTGVHGLRQVIASLMNFMVGDLLGVMLVAPPLLWAAQGRFDRRAFVRGRRLLLAIAETIVVLGAAMALTALLTAIGLGAPVTPVLLAVAWVGLRFGRMAGWGAVLVVAVTILPFTVAPLPLAERFALHMSLASIVVVGYLAGSFADAQAQAKIDLTRRDRMLFQAERLKTLRAMSVAVIHEISQPLSTLALEASHLREIAAGADPEIAETAALIDRKAATLSQLVRRLRRFGGRAVDEPSALPVAALIDTVAALVAPEAKAARAVLSIAPVAPDLFVLGQEIELSQAIVNLVRNAFQAGDGRVFISVERGGDEVRIGIRNACVPGREARAGMGVGALVARAIVEAHGGTLTRSVDTSGSVHAMLTLPLTEGVR